MVGWRITFVIFVRRIPGCQHICRYVLNSFNRSLFPAIHRIEATEMARGYVSRQCRQPLQPETWKRDLFKEHGNLDHFATEKDNWGSWQGNHWVTSLPYCPTMPFAKCYLDNRPLSMITVGKKNHPLQRAALAQIEGNQKKATQFSIATLGRQTHAYILYLDFRGAICALAFKACEAEPLISCFYDFSHESNVCLGNARTTVPCSLGKDRGLPNFLAGNKPICSCPFLEHSCNRLTQGIGISNSKLRYRSYP